MLRLRLTPVVLLLVLALSACGGGDDEASSTTGSAPEAGAAQLSAPAYRSEVKKICTERERVLDAAEVPQEQTGAALATFIEDGVPEFEKATERLGALAPPAELRAPHDELVTSQREYAAELTRVADLLRPAQDPEQVVEKEGANLERLDGQVSRISARLGVPECETAS